MNYNACDILLTLEGSSLEVTTGLGHDLMVRYAGAEVMIGGQMFPMRGEGRSFEDACADYLDHIRGKVLVFEDETEVRVLG